MLSLNFLLTSKAVCVIKPFLFLFVCVFAMGKRGQGKATAAQGTLPPALIKRFKSVVGYQATTHGDQDVIALRKKYEEGIFEEKHLDLI